jgi:hypothetical protein
VALFVTMSLTAKRGAARLMSTKGDLELAAAQAASGILPGRGAEGRSTKRVLDPADRIAEVLFGLIMVLTFTGSLSVADSGRDDVVAMLIGALGCNLAWGVIDGLFYLMGCLAEKGRNLATLKAVLAAKTGEEARGLIVGALPPLVASLLKPEELDALRDRALRLPQPPNHARLDAHDWLGAMGVFLLVFLVTFPVAIPFMFFDTTALAMRVSNAVAIGLLFAAGAAYGKVIHRSPLAIGVGMVVVGLVIVAFTIALGG